MCRCFLIQLFVLLYFFSSWLLALLLLCLLEVSIFVILLFLKSFLILFYSALLTSEKLVHDLNWSDDWCSLFSTSENLVHKWWVLDLWLRFLKWTSVWLKCLNCSLSAVWIVLWVLLTDQCCCMLWLENFRADCKHWSLLAITLNSIWASFS